MESVHEFDDYKPLIAWASRAAKVTLARLAAAAGVHRQYLTQVIRHKAHLNDDQAYRIGSSLGWTGHELEYFLLLVQEGKSSHPATRAYFTERRQLLRAKMGKVSSELPKATQLVAPERIDLSEYYLTVPLQICHAHLFIPEYQKDPSLLAGKLHLSAAAVETPIATLQRLGLAEIIAGRPTSRLPFLHLEPGSPLSQQNHRNWRLYAASMGLQQQDGNLFFSSTITAERRLRLACMQALRGTIGQLHAQLGGSKDEEVFQINIDVFGL